MCAKRAEKQALKNPKPPKHRQDLTDAIKDAAESQIKDRLQEVKYDQKDFTVRHLVEDYQEGSFYIPDYQRDPIWSPKEQCRFIESVLLGLPIPFMFVAEVEAGTLEIVDGVQRISSLEAFLADDLILEDLEKLPLLVGFKYSDLPQSRQMKFGNRSLRIIVLDEATTPEIRREIFDRVNTSGKKANPAEIRRGSKSGPFMTFVKSMAEDPTFRRICPMSSLLYKRREGEELVLRFFAYSDKYQKFEHDVFRFLDEFVDDNLKKFDKKRMQLEFKRTMQFVEKYFPPGGFGRTPTAKMTPRVRFEAIAVGVNLALREKPDLVPSLQLEWLKDDSTGPSTFSTLTRTHASNSSVRLANRVEFVRDELLKAAR